MGLASLSSGCAKLKKLECCGLFQLADPRLSATKVVPKNVPWETIVGVAAVGKYCPDIEHIDFSGCSRLNMVIQKNVSLLYNLHTLLLSGCPVSSDTITAVAKNCKYITEINFSDCGSGIDGKCMLALTSNCKGLKTINLGE